MSSELRKETNKASQKRYWEKNKEKYRQRRKEQTLRNRSWFQSRKVGLSCSECGENHPACIKFHHLNPDEKEFNVADMVVHGYGIERIEAEIAKCVVLCGNCHDKLHYNTGLV